MKEQIKGYTLLENALAKLHFKGEVFFAKDQKCVIKFLGEPNERI